MYYGDEDYDENYIPENDPMPGGDADPLYDDLIDDGLLESIAIIVLAGALVWLIYYRQRRQLAHQRGQEAAGGQDGAAQAGQQQQQDNQGLFPQPGDPAFGQWAAGGVGH